jgi:hypothetical protein
MAARIPGGNTGMDGRNSRRTLPPGADFPHRRTAEKKWEFPEGLRRVLSGNSFPRSALFLQESMWKSGTSVHQIKAFLENERRIIFSSEKRYP